MNGRGQGVVRARRAKGDHRLGALRLGAAQEKGQLAHLVSAIGIPAYVVALDEETGIRQTSGGGYGRGQLGDGKMWMQH